MNHALRELLRQDADGAEIPTLDANDVIRRAERRLHRRRVTAALATVAAVAAIAAGSALLARGQLNSQGPVAPPPSSKSSDGGVDPLGAGARPLVYAEGLTVHVLDKVIEARHPVAFIGATDDGAVYEAALDGTLWFTDGTSTSVIGTSGFTAAPTAHDGVVTTGDSGSLVVWADMSGRKNQVPTEFVVYDTSRGEEVGSIPFTPRGAEDRVVYVDEAHVYFTPDSGCWAIDVNKIHPCQDPNLFRFDVASAETTKVGPAELYAEMGRQARMFKAVAQPVPTSPAPACTSGRPAGGWPPSPPVAMP